MIVLIFINFAYNFFAPKKYIGYENLSRLYYYLIGKAVIVLLFMIFAIITCIRIVLYFYERYKLNKVLAVFITCALLLNLYLDVSVCIIQSPCSAKGINKFISQISVLHNIRTLKSDFVSANANSYENEICTAVYNDNTVEGYYSGATRNYFKQYFLRMDNVEIKDIELDDYILTLKIGKDEYSEYSDLFNLVKPNDEFIVEFYVDKNGQNTKFIKSIKCIEKKYDVTYSMKISMNEIDNSYVFRQIKGSQSENVDWVLLKDGEIQKLANNNKTKELYLSKNIPSGKYTVMLCVDYNPTTYSYTQVSNAIEIII